MNVCAYQATLMRKGNSKAAQVCILDNSNGTLFDDSMLPADDDSREGAESEPRSYSEASTISCPATPTFTSTSSG